MANSIVLETSMETPFNGFHAVWTKFNLGTSGETVVVPQGCTVAAMLETGSWTLTITAGADNDTVTVVGTPGTSLTLVTRHGGNPASVRS